MAELCLECCNKINGTNYNRRKYIISKDLDLCEECGEFKHVIIVERKYFYMNILGCIFIPIKFFYRIIYKKIKLRNL